MVETYLQIVAIIAPFIAGDLVWVHLQVMDLKIKMAVNISRDDQVWEHLEKQESILEEIRKDIQIIKTDLEVQKNKRR